MIGDTGVERSTGELVAMVRKRREQYPSIIDPNIETGGEIALRAVEAVETGDLNTLGDLINLNHALLCAIGVSNEPLERLVYAARDAGAYGAKLTGAGGGGCMVALAPQGRVKDIVEAIMDAGGSPSQQGRQMKA